jgi:hypothetical protein
VAERFSDRESVEKAAEVAKRLRADAKEEPV